MIDNFYSSLDVTRVIESRRMRWAIHVARKGQMKINIIFQLEDLREETSWEIWV